MNVTYKINGQTLTEAEYRKWSRKRVGFLKESGADVETALATEEGRKALTSTVGFTEHWHKHESISAAMPLSQAQEHAEWIQDQKLVGVELVAKPSEHCAVVKFSDAGSKDRYLAARGLVDRSSGGSGVQANASVKPNKKWRSWMDPNKKKKRSQRVTS